MEKKKRDQLKLWALQCGYSNISALAAASGISRNAIYAAINYQPGDCKTLGKPGLDRLAELLDITPATMLDWYEGRL